MLMIPSRWSTTTADSRGLLPYFWEQHPICRFLTADVERNRCVHGESSDAKVLVRYLERDKGMVIVDEDEDVSVPPIS